MQLERLTGFGRQVYRIVATPSQWNICNCISVSGWYVALYLCLLKRGTRLLTLNQYVKYSHQYDTWQVEFFVSDSSINAIRAVADINASRGLSLEEPSASPNSPRKPKRMPVHIMISGTKKCRRVCLLGFRFCSLYRPILLFVSPSEICVVFLLRTIGGKKYKPLV